MLEKIPQSRLKPPLALSAKTRGTRRWREDEPASGRDRITRRVFLYSPIKPMKTGTADYFDLILAQFAASDIDRSCISIVVDDQFLSSKLLVAELMGFPVLSYHQVPNFVRSDETRVFFLANNEFHAYCYESLSRIEKESGGRIVSVIHEPSCFMLMNSLSANRRHTFDDSQLFRAMAHQFGEKAEAIVTNRRAGALDFEVEYLVSAQGITLAKSDEVWTHNKFTKLKLELENCGSQTPRIIVSSHPSYPATAKKLSKSAKTSKRNGIYRIGIFGWVASSKRVNPAIQAFALALQTLPKKNHAEFELIVVGKLPSKDVYDPVGLSSALGVSDCVKFFNFVSTDEFEELVNTCDLLLNLRFPSCGETSGTLERAVSSGIPVVTTAYQAFAELPSSGHVSPFWPRELTQLYMLFRSFFRKEVSLPRAAKQSEPIQIADLIYGHLYSEVN